MTDRNRTTRLEQAIPAHHIPTDEDIERLGYHDTVVQAALHVWRERQVSWDECLRLMVAGLVKMNAALSAELEKAHRHAPGPPVMIENAGHGPSCGMVTGTTLRCTCGYLVTQDDMRWR